MDTFNCMRNRIQASDLSRSKQEPEKDLLFMLLIMTSSSVMKFPLAFNLLGLKKYKEDVVLSKVHLLSVISYVTM